MEKPQEPRDSSLTILGPVYLAQLDLDHVEGPACTDCGNTIIPRADCQNRQPVCPACFEKRDAIRTAATERGWFIGL